MEHLKNKIAKILLKTFAFIVILVLLILIIDFISKVINSNNIRHDYKIALQDCGHKPYVVVEEDGFWGPGHRVLKPDNPKYEQILEKDIMSIPPVGESTEVHSYKCSANEVEAARPGILDNIFTQYY